MARTSYQNRLEKLRGDVAAFGETARERFDTARRVLESGDTREAARVIEGDSEINEWYLDIERECTQLLALQQPVASDLRFVTASFKIVTDIERVGDLATNLAAYGRDADGSLFGRAEYAALGQEASEMLGDALRAYNKQNPNQARDIAKHDNTLDAHCEGAMETIMLDAIQEQPIRKPAVDSTLDDVSRALLTIRDLERVGDHAVNIGARTLYMCENDEGLLY